jgi:hypothetical protein
MQKGTGWDVQDRTRGSVTKDVWRNTGWRMSIWTQSRIVTDKRRITNGYPDEFRNSYR